MFGKITTCVLLCISLVSCGIHNTNSSLNNSKSDYTNKSDNSITSDDAPITIEAAEANVLEAYNKYLNPDNAKSNKALFMCESVSVINGKVYYLIRGFNHIEESRVTFGWYFVDIYSGAVFDAGPAINDMMPIGENVGP